MVKDISVKPHHHGNLRQALILAGLEILKRDGADELTLRKCAVIAGVSHAAPAHHFNGLISLKVAIITQGHRLFSQSMRQAAKAAGGSPQAQLAAICDGYICFAKAHTSLFKFMFMPHGAVPNDIDDQTRDEHHKYSRASYEILHQACIPFVQKGDDPLNIETMVWSLVHGYAMLFTGDQGAQSPGGPVPDFGKILPTLRIAH